MSEWEGVGDKIKWRIIIFVFFVGAVFVLGGIVSIIINGEDGSIAPIIIGIPIIILGIFLKKRREKKGKSFQI
jgi:hypothetical protein